MYRGEATEQKLRGFVTSPDRNGLCLIAGDPGSGKSSILSKLIADWREESPNAFVFPHFVGASAASADIQQLLQRLLRQLEDRFGPTPESRKMSLLTFGLTLPGRLLDRFVDWIVPNASEYVSHRRNVLGDLEPLMVSLRKRFSAISRDIPVLLVIDSSDEVDEDRGGAWLLAMIVQELLRNAKVILSCTNTQKRNSVLEAVRPLATHQIDVSPLTDGERLAMLHDIPAVSAKMLDAAQRELLRQNPATHNPLYLLVALEELRGFGSFEQLEKRILTFPTGDAALSGIFEQVLERLEFDFDAALVRETLSLLACSRDGLSEIELVEMLKEDLPTSAGELFALLRQIRAYLFNRGALVDFAHTAFVESISNRYLSTLTECREGHKRLVRYLSSKLETNGDGSCSADSARSLSELPYHQFHAGMRAALEMTLCDLSFVEQKCALGRTHDLQMDFQRALPDVAPPIRTAQRVSDLCRVICPFCQKPSHVDAEMLGGLVACPYCGGRLHVNSFVLQAGDNEDAYSKDGETNFTAVCPVESELALTCQLAEFAEFVGTVSHILADQPSLVYQLAANFRKGSAPAVQALRLQTTRPGTQCWLRRLDTTRRSSGIRVLEHCGKVTTCAVSGDGRLIACAEDDGVATIRDARTGRVVTELHSDDHLTDVRGCAFSPDNATVLTADVGMVIPGRTQYLAGVCLWDVETGTLTTSLPSNAANCCEYAPDGTRILTCGPGGWKLWNAKSQQLVAESHGKDFGTNGCRFTADGRHFLHASASKTGEASIRRWRAEDGVEVKPADAATTLVSREKGYFRGRLEDAFSCSPDGRHVLFRRYSQPDEVAAQRGGLCVASTSTAQVIATLSLNNSTACAYSPDNRFCAGGNLHGELRLWDAESFEELATIKAHDDEIKDCPFMPDGKTIVTASVDGIVRFWDVAVLLESSHQDRKMSANAAAFSPCGRWLATVYDDLQISNVSTGETQCCVKAAWNESIQSCDFSPDSTEVFCGCADDGLRVYDTVTGDLKRTGHLSGKMPLGKRKAQAVTVLRYLAFGLFWGIPVGVIWGGMLGMILPSGYLAVTGQFDRFVPDFVPNLKQWAYYGSVILWPCCVVAMLYKSFEDRKKGTPVCAVSPNGKMVATGHADRSINVWDAAAARDVVQVDVQHRIVSNQYPMWGGVDAPHHPKIMLVGGTSSHSTGTTTCRFSPYGDTCSSGYWRGTNSTWEVTSGKPGQAWATDGNGKNVSDFSPDGTQIVVSHDVQQLAVFDVARRAVQVELEGHDQIVTACRFSPDGSLIASTSWDGTLKLWNASTGEKVAVYHAETPLNSVVWHPRGRMLAIISDECELIALENKENLPLYVTMWQDAAGSVAAISCPVCRTWTEVDPASAGAIMACKSCHTPLRLRSKSITGDWTAIASGWQAGGKAKDSPRSPYRPPD